MKILALETSGEYCSVALWIDGAVIARHCESPARHTELLLPLCEEVRTAAGLALSALDGVAFGAGPGAFTGVRVAASAAHGIALAHDLPLMPISSLAALARGGWRANALAHQLAVLDARRHEVYWGLYQCAADGRVVALQDERVSTADAVALETREPCGGVGRGLALLGASGERLSLAARAAATFDFPHAEDVAALAAVEWQAGRAHTGDIALPVYLRGAF